MSTNQGGLDKGSVGTRRVSESCLSENSYTVPYFCDSTELPDTLPTSDEIEQAVVSLPTIRDLEHGRIVLVKGCFVVKYGVYVSENEGYVLLFLQKHQFVPAPKELYT